MSRSKQLVSYEPKPLVHAVGHVAEKTLEAVVGDGCDHFNLAGFRFSTLQIRHHLYSFMDFARAAMKRGGRPSGATGIQAFAYGVLAAEVIANYYRITPGEIFAETREIEPIAGARSIAMAIAVQCGGWQKTQVGEVFCRDRTTVTHAVNLIEQKRLDDGDFDFTVEMFENAILDHWAVAGPADGLAKRLEAYL